jgi:histidinol-phosphate aminotransferase
MSFADRLRRLAEIERRRIVMPDNVRMRLNRLERPEPWPDDLLRLIEAGAALDKLQQYPSYPEFYESLSRFFQVPVDRIVVGAGIEEFIRSLFMLCIRPGDKVAFLWPTCAMFEIYARAFGAEVVRIVTDPDNDLTCDLTCNQIAAQLPDDLKLLILANPGQPVDCFYGYAAIYEIARACEARGAVLAIDEAYHGFGALSVIGEVEHHPNMVVLRTFSKAFGAASIRLGFAVAGPVLHRALNAVRQSGEVSALSMHVATVLMDWHERFVAPGNCDVAFGREVLREAANADLGLRARGRWANHVLIELPDAQAVAGRLAERGVLVRAGMPAPLDKHMLVTCGSPALMAEFVDELRAAL